MYGGIPYAGGAYAGGGTAVADISVETEPRNFAVEVSFTTDALAEPVWVDVSGDVRSWDVGRGRTKELERFQPGRATIVLDNSDRAYDSQHATGPWFGNLRPNRRIRIRETFNGVTYPRFDGFVDRWSLDYPEYGLDAVATVTATDGMKVFARSDLPRSVYYDAVKTDAPAVWYRLDDNQVQQGDVAAVVLNSGTLGAAADGTFVGPPTLGAQGLVVHDPGTSMEVTDSTANPGTGNMGVLIDDVDFDLADHASWAIEFWARPGNQAIDPSLAFTNGPSIGSASGLTIRYNNTGGGTWTAIWVATDLTTRSVTAPGVYPVHGLYHVVVRHGPDRVLTIHVNAVVTNTPATTVGTFASNDSHVGYEPANAEDNWVGAISNVAIYTAALGTNPLTDAQIAAHYAAGTTPWQGDAAGMRAGRVADEADWPTFLREIDAGVTTFQSASIFGQTVLEHLHKVAESEAGIFFMSRAGFLRLIARAQLLLRTPQAIFGDLSEQWVDLPGTAGNYISTPDSAAASVTGDIDIRVKVAMDDWTPAARATLVNKWVLSGNQRSYRLAVTTAGALQLWWSADGTAELFTNSTAATGIADGATKWVRATMDVNDGAGNRVITFYTSDNGVSWTQLGTTVTTAGTTSIFDSTATLQLGALGTIGDTEILVGNVYYAEVRNGIDGPVVARFDPNVVAITGVRTPTTVPGAGGATWTINGTGWVWGQDPEIGYRRAVFDDGFDSVRNRVTISRLNGVAKQATSAASVAEFGHMDYVLDGLLHNTDAHSLAYAEFIRDNYPDPIRRVVALELGPAAAGAEAALYPQMLGRELGDMITVKHRPPGGGEVWEQDVVIEGTTDRWDPHGFRTATWILAPAPGGVF